MLPVEPIFVVAIVADDVNVTNEEMLYNALCHWVNHNIESRLDHLPSLLSLLKLPLMSAEVIYSPEHWQQHKISLPQIFFTSHSKEFTLEE